MLLINIFNNNILNNQFVCFAVCINAIALDCETVMQQLPRVLSLKLFAVLWLDPNPRCCKKLEKFNGEFLSVSLIRPTARKWKLL